MWRDEPAFSLTSCPVAMPHYSARSMRFGSRGPIEFASLFPDRSSRIRHRNALTDKARKDAVRGLGARVTGKVSLYAFRHFEKNKSESNIPLSRSR